MKKEEGVIETLVDKTKLETLQRRPKNYPPPADSVATVVDKVSEKK